MNSVIDLGEEWLLAALERCTSYRGMRIFISCCCLNLTIHSGNLSAWEKIIHGLHFSTKYETILSVINVIVSSKETSLIRERCFSWKLHTLLLPNVFLFSVHPHLRPLSSPTSLLSTDHLPHPGRVWRRYLEELPRACVVVVDRAPLLQKAWMD